MNWKLAPSILSADFSCLGEQVRAVEKAGVELIHVDVMDGHFVPNLSMGPLVVRALRPLTNLVLDVHLMVTDPEEFLEPFVTAGADQVTIHVESNGDHARMFEWLKARSVGCGIAVSPDTPVEQVIPWLSTVDTALVMTVYPGFGGQSFLAENLAKVRAIRQRDEELRAADERQAPLDIEVDGGIHDETLLESKRAGANVFVAGNSVFGSSDPAAAVQRLHDSMKAG